jgi:hypothetical protein
LTERIWDYPKGQQSKKPQAPQPTAKTPTAILEGVNLTRQLSYLFEKYDLPMEVESTMRQMHSRLIELEARETVAVQEAQAGKQPQSYASVVGNTSATRSRAKASKQLQQEEQLKMVTFLAQTENENDRKLAAYRIMTGKNPVTNRPTGKPRPVVQRMVKSTDSIANPKFLDALNEHQVLHVTGVKRIYIEVIKSILQKQGLDMANITHLTFFDNNTLQMVVKKTYVEAVCSVFRDLPQEDDPLEITIDPTFPTPDMDVDNDDPSILKAQHDFIVKMALSCTRNRTLIGATVLQRIIPIEHQENLHHEIRRLAAGRMAAKRL